MSATTGMRAGTRGQAGGGGLAVVVGLVLAGLVMLGASVPAAPAAPAAAMPALPSGHAVERHGEMATVALRMVEDGGDCRVCTDGRRRCTANQGSIWAVVVYEWVRGAWEPVTSFLCGQDYAVGVQDNCDERWRGGHS